MGCRRRASVITDNGRPVAQILPLPHDHLTALEDAGLLRRTSRTIAEIGPRGVVTTHLRDI